MPLYEHVFLARQDMSTQAVDALVKEYSDLVTSSQGKIAKTEYWGLKTLAFKIKKSRKAHYTLMNIEAEPATIREMERRMGLAPDVLRFLTVRVEEHEAEPSAQMRKTDRDDRPGGDRGGFRGGPRGDRGGGGFRPGGDRGGFRGDREGGSTFRSRPPGGPGGGRLPRDGDAPRPPRAPAGETPPRRSEEE